ncbi:MAG: tetratricopeptide repeat protein, partial [Planctomycetota bacterium]
LAVGWFWYLGTLAPVIGLVQAGSQAMADRFTYVPSIGILIMVAWGAAELFPKWRYRSVVLPIAVALLLGAMLVRTRNQVRLWKDNLTLFGHTLAITENNPIIENSYACALFEDGKLDEAVVHLEKALRISPGFALYCNNLGRVLLKQGKADKAITCFNQVLHTKKDLPDVHYFLGLAKVKQGRHNDAITHFSEALQLKDDYVDAHLQLAYSLFTVGRIQPAIEHFHRVLQLHPDHTEALNALAWVLATSNDTDKQKSAQAVRFAERACEITGYRNAGALDTLAAAYASAGRFPDAIRTAEQAIDAARADSKEELAQQIQDRLLLYEAGRRYREK